MELLVRKRCVHPGRRRVKIEDLEWAGEFFSEPYLHCAQPRRFWYFAALISCQTYLKTKIIGSLPKIRCIFLPNVDKKTELSSKRGAPLKAWRSLGLNHYGKSGADRGAGFGHYCHMRYLKVIKPSW